MADINGTTVEKEFDGKSKKEIAEIYLGKTDDREKFKSFFSSYNVLTGQGGLGINIEPNLSDDLKKDWEEFKKMRAERLSSLEARNVSNAFASIESSVNYHPVVQKMKSLADNKPLAELPMDKLGELINSKYVRGIISGNDTLSKAERDFFEKTVLTAYNRAKTLQEKGDRMEMLAGRVFDSLKERLDQSAKQIAGVSNEGTVAEQPQPEQQPETQPVSEPAPEPAVQPVPQLQAAPEPDSEPVPEPEPEPAPEPAPEPEFDGRDRDVGQPDDSHVDEEVGQGAAIDFFKYPDERFGKFSENLESYLSELKFNPEGRDKNGKPLLDEETLKKWDRIKEMNGERSSGVMTVMDENGNPKKDANGLNNVRESIYSSDKLQRAAFGSLESVYGPGEEAKDALMNLAKDLYHVDSLADLNPNQVNLLLNNPEITALTKEGNANAAVNKSYLASVKNVCDKAERTDKHKAEMEALEKDVWKTFEPILVTQATATLNANGIPIPEPVVKEAVETVVDSDKGEKPEEEKKDEKEKKEGEEEKKEGEKSEKEGEKSAAEKAAEKKEDKKEDLSGQITDKDLMEGFSLSDDAIQGLLDRNKDGSLLTMMTQFANAKTPEEAVQSLLVNLLLYLPRKLLLAVDVAETVLKEKNKYIEEQREKRKDEIAGLKGLGASDRVKGVEAYLIKAKVHLDKNGNYKGTSELASLLNEKDPALMRKFGITFDEKGNVVGSLSKIQENALIDAALMQGYHETYNGLNPSKGEFEKLRAAANKNIKNGDYLRMAAEEAAAAAVASEDNSTASGDKPAPDKDEKSLWEDEEFLKNHMPLIKAWGDVSRLASNLKKEDPKLLEGLGLKFDDKGLVQGKITDEQRLELLNRIFHSQYLKNHKEGLPSTAEVEEAIKNAQTFMSSGIYERLAKELEAKMAKDKEDKKDSPEKKKEDEKPIDFSTFNGVEVNNAALKHKMNDIHVDAKPAEKPAENILVAAPKIETGTLEDAKAQKLEEKMRREAEEKHEVKTSTGETVELNNAALNQKQQDVKVDAPAETNMKFVPVENVSDITIGGPQKAPEVPPPAVQNLKVNKEALDKMSPNTVISSDKENSADEPIKLRTDKSEEITVGTKKMSLNKAYEASVISTTPNALIKEAKDLGAEKAGVDQKAKEVEKNRGILNKYTYTQDDKIFFISPEKTVSKTPESSRTMNEGR